jgi:hypothetical protein
VAEHAGGSWADAGGESAWGPVRLGHADPRDESIGLLAIGAIAAALMPSDVTLELMSGDDFRTPEFSEAFGRLERDGVPNSFFAELTTESAYEQYRVNAADFVFVARSEFTTVPPDSEVVELPTQARAVVTFTPTRNGPEALSDSETEALAEALTARGWGDPTDEGTGIPRGGVLAALLDVWEETVR